MTTIPTRVAGDTGVLADQNALAAMYDNPAANWAQGNATYVPLNADSVIFGNVLFRGAAATGSAADFGGAIAAGGAGGTFYRAPMSLTATGGTNGARGDSIASDTANGSGATSFNGFYENSTGGAAFTDKGSLNSYVAFMTLSPYSGGGSVYGEVGAFVAAVTNNRAGGRAEAFEAAVNSGAAGAGIEGRNSGFLAVMSEFAAIANYWRRGFWAASQGDHVSGDAYYADGSGGWTNFLNFIAPGGGSALKANSSGTFAWGDGTNPTDVSLGRTGAAVLGLTGNLQATVDVTARQGGNATSIGQQGPSGEAGIAMLDAVIYRSGAATMQIGSTAGQKIITGFAGGSIGFYGHAAVAQPAAPVTLADVIAVIRGCGLSA